MPGLDNILDFEGLTEKERQKKIEERTVAKIEIAQGIKNRVKGVIKLERKEIDFDGQRVSFTLSQTDVARSESALSFTAILELAEAINKGK